MIQNPQSDVSELPEPAHSDAVVEKVARAIAFTRFQRNAGAGLDADFAWDCLSDETQAKELAAARAALSVLPQHPALIECVEALKETLSFLDEYHTTRAMRLAARAREALSRLREHRMSRSHPYTYIRHAYGVDPEVGEWVKHTVTGRYGVVARPISEAGGGHYVKVRFMGDKFSLPCHPKELLYAQQVPEQAQGNTDV